MLLVPKKSRTAIIRKSLQGAAILQVIRGHTATGWRCQVNSMVAWPRLSRWRQVVSLLLRSGHPVGRSINSPLSHRKFDSSVESPRIWLRFNESWNPVFYICHNIPIIFIKSERCQGRKSVLRSWCEAAGLGFSRSAPETPGMPSSARHGNSGIDKGTTIWMTLDDYGWL